MSDTEVSLKNRIQALERKLSREHSARLSAETMLNHYSREAYLANQALRRELSDLRYSYLDLLDFLEKNEVHLHYVPDASIGDMGERMSLLSQLAAGIAHEVNNPVGFIKSNLEIFQQLFNDVLSAFTELKQVADEFPGAHIQIQDIEQKYMLTEMAEMGAELTDSSAQGIRRISRVIESLRTYAYPTLTDKQPVSLARLLEEAVEGVILKLPQAVHISIEPFENPLYLKGCEEKLRKLFANMLANAIAAVGNQGEIAITGLARKASITIVIADDGKGIEDEALPLIFTPFYTTGAPGDGVGLGLCVAMAIMEEHQGHISVKSQPGRGSNFTLVFPNI
ncbi:sensor histidine kinase [Salinimonas lutimaris]|uniref:sensor histidine kinase n=1 Tax=Salinimonas lutimaris TaxID=914153 RepID=UPI0010C1521B|nr:ATP-binding protein [Salinimonas lutimaris]